MILIVSKRKSLGRASTFENRLEIILSRQFRSQEVLKVVDRVS